MCDDGAWKIAAGAGGVLVVVVVDGNTSSSYLFRSQSCVHSWSLLLLHRCQCLSDCSGRVAVVGMVVLADSTGDYVDIGVRGYGADYFLRYPWPIPLRRLQLLHLLSSSPPRRWIAEGFLRRFVGG